MTVLVVVDGGLLRLRDLAAPLSRPHAALVDDPRELHGPGAGADREPLHHHRRRQLLNTYPGIILPQLIAPVTVIVYKQFFDSVPRDFREAAVIDGANEFQLLFRIFLPMNWGVTTALAIITFIGAWNTFLWPFLAAQNEEMMTVTVGITAVQDAFGVYYARCSPAPCSPACRSRSPTSSSSAG